MNVEAQEQGLPASVEAERGILGVLLLDNSAYIECAGKLEQDDFLLDSHQRLFARIQEILDKGQDVNIITLAEALKRKKEVDYVRLRPCPAEFQLYFDA